MAHRDDRSKSVSTSKGNPTSTQPSGRTDERVASAVNKRPFSSDDLVRTIALAPFTSSDRLTDLVVYVAQRDTAGSDRWYRLSVIGTFQYVDAARAHAAHLAAEYDVPVLDIREPMQLLRDTPVARAADDARVRRQGRLGGEGAHKCGLCGGPPAVLVPNRVDSLKPLHWILCCQDHADAWPTWSHPLVRHLSFLPLPERVRSPPREKTLAEIIAEEEEDPDAPPPFSI